MPLDPDPTARPDLGRRPGDRGARNAARAGTVRTFAVAGAIVSLGAFSALAAVNSADEDATKDSPPAQSPAAVENPIPGQDDFFATPGAGLAPATGGVPDARSAGS